MSRIDALVVVDMQNDFCHANGRLYHPDLSRVVDPIELRIQSAMRNGENIFFSFDSHSYGEFKKSREGDIFPFHAEIGSWGEKPVFQQHIVEQVNKYPHTDWSRKSSFLNKRLGDKIWALTGEWKKEHFYFPRIEICGVLTSICVLNLALYIRSIAPMGNITVRKSLTQDVDAEARQAAFICMKKNLIDLYD